MRKIVAALLVITCSINTAWAGKRIRGTVKSADENEVMPGVTIQPYNSKNEVLPDGTYTDTNGNFDFSVPDNTDHVVIHIIGHKDQIFSPSELNGKTITLDTNPTMLGEVTVIGHRPSTSTSSSGGDGCDNEANDRITPELALCSVHAYNIGQSINPSGTDKQLMKDVVALKATVISQQMNRQYEYMESMIRRFRTQLEKAILTTKLQSAGTMSSSPDADSGAAGTYGKNSTGVTAGGLANAEDCLGTASSSAEALQCLLRNVAKIQSAVTNGDMGTARRQLSADRNSLAAFNSLKTSCDTGQQNCVINVQCENALADEKICAKAINSGSNRNDMITCLGQFRACIIANTEISQRNSN